MTRRSITQSQYTLLLLAVPLVSSVLHYTYFVYRVGTRGWLATIVVGVLCSLVLGFPMAALMNRFPGKTIVDISRSLYGKFFGSALTLPVFLFSGGLTAIFILRGMAELYARTLLPRTPETIIVAVGWFTAAYVASLGPEGLARLAELAVYLIELPLIIPLFIVALRSVNLHYLEPLLWWPAGLPFSKDFWASLTFATGMPTLLIFGAYLSPAKQAFRPVVWAAAGTFVLLVILTVIPLGTLGPETVKMLSFPVNVALNTINVTVLFVQQLSYLAVALWSLFFFLGAGLTLWFCARGFVEIVGVGSERVWTWGLAIALYIAGERVIDFVAYLQLFTVWAVASSLVYVWVMLWYWPAIWLKRRPPAKGETHG